jgi:imidazole glycerol-phosphate synthase subunit HisH
MIRIVDYGVGNIQAFVTMFKRLGLPAARAHTPTDLADATRLILPGVGAFDHAMQLLNQSGIREPLEAMVLGQQVPVLGVCVGMQMLASGSDEGELPGLNWIPGRVRAFANTPEAAQLPMPHMGWNDLQVTPGTKLFTGFEPQPRFYFLHSYFFDCEDKANVAATASYGLEFACVVSKRHIHGMQCHPEKSHHFGAQLLKNFAEL